MFIIFLALVILVNSTNNVILYGININGTEVPGSERFCDYYDNSCCKTIMELLNNKTLCLSYISYTPFFIKQCSTLDDSYNVNMISIFVNISQKFDFARSYNSIGETLTDGCKLFQTKKYIDILITGRSLD